jgi:DNA-binding response OmpR family regulator
MNAFASRRPVTTAGLVGAASELNEAAELTMVEPSARTSSLKSIRDVGSILSQTRHALVVSTDRKMIENLRGALGVVGYGVRASRFIAAGIRRFRLSSPDLLILDARLLEKGLPKHVVQRFHVWRRHGAHYHPNGAARRAGTPSSVGVASVLRRLTLDSAALSVRIGDRVASFTQAEFSILVTLLRHRGRALTRDELLDATKQAGSPFDRVIDRHICNIRHKIDVSSNFPSIIETVRGIGYRIGDEHDRHRARPIHKACVKK